MDKAVFNRPQGQYVRPQGQYVTIDPNISSLHLDSDDTIGSGYLRYCQKATPRQEAIPPSQMPASKRALGEVGLSASEMAEDLPSSEQ